MRTPLSERLWRRVNFSGPVAINMDTCCWEWTGHVIADGYGHIRSGKTMVLTHRLAWQVTKGEIPDDLLVCHKCDKPRCVRPDHLFLGTHADNVADRDAKGRRLAPIGETNGRAKLSMSIVVDIRKSTDKRKSLAVRYSVSKSLVDKIKNRQVWAHVP